MFFTAVSCPCFGRPQQEDEPLIGTWCYDSGHHFYTISRSTSGALEFTQENEIGTLQLDQEWYLTKLSEGTLRLRFDNTHRRTVVSQFMPNGHTTWQEQTIAIPLQAVMLGKKKSFGGILADTGGEPTSADATVTLADFRVGEEVSVWSTSGNKWMDDAVVAGASCEFDEQITVVYNDGESVNTFTVTLVQAATVVKKLRTDQDRHGKKFSIGDQVRVWSESFQAWIGDGILMEATLAEGLTVIYNNSETIKTIPFAQACDLLMKCHVEEDDDSEDGLPCKKSSSEVNDSSELPLRSKSTSDVGTHDDSTTDV